MSSEPKLDLTPRELEIVQCLYRDLTYCEIADHIGMGADTVKLNLWRIMDKLGVSTRLELLQAARAQQANTPCPVCSMLIGEHSDEQFCECVRKGREKRTLASS